jgi:hypothetical protein
MAIAAEHLAISSFAMHFMMMLPPGPPYCSGTRIWRSPISPNNSRNRSTGKLSSSYLRGDRSNLLPHQLLYGAAKLRIFVVGIHLGDPSLTERCIAGVPFNSDFAI